MSVSRQIGTAVGLNVTSIPQRLWMSIATVGSIALVVGILVGILALGEGFRAALNNTGEEDVALILRAGSTAELSSGVSRDQYRLLEDAPGVARDAEGRPILSGEVFVTVDANKKSNGQEVNVTLRGVTDAAFGVRSGVEIVAGRMFEPGSAEIVVGENLLRQYSNFALGEPVRFGPDTWEVVGLLSGEGLVTSEIWADLGTVQNFFNRGSTVQSVRAKLEQGGGLAALQAHIEEDPRLRLSAETEKAFYADQSGGLDQIINLFGWPLAMCLGLGALAGAVNAMNSSVEARAKEVGTLRAIGFGGLAAFVGVIAEALTLAALGGALALTIAFVIFNVLGWSVSTLGAGFTQVVFEFTLTPYVIAVGLAMALAIGLLGGLAPAVKAARTPVLRL